MFTGLVLAVGAVEEVRDRPGGARELSLRGAPLAGASVGQSVAVAGVCLTAVETSGETASFEVAAETLSRSTLGALAAGARVNLELPLRAADRLGGHFVQGHVDETGEVVAAGGTDADYRVRIRHPEPRWIAEKGSVAVDGVSLTVAAVLGDAFEVMLIPHTRAVTTLGDLGAGARVNLEYDILAKYVAALLPGRREGPEP